MAIGTKNQVVKQLYLRSQTSKVRVYIQGPSNLAIVGEISR